MIETPHVTGSSRALAARITARLSAQVIVGRVIAPARHLDEAHVALQHDRLGRLVNARQAQPRRHLA